MIRNNEKVDSYIALDDIGEADIYKKVFNFYKSTVDIEDQLDINNQYLLSSFVSVSFLNGCMCCTLRRTHF